MKLAARGPLQLGEVLLFTNCSLLPELGKVLCLGCAGKAKRACSGELLLLHDAVPVGEMSSGLDRGLCGTALSRESCLVQLGTHPGCSAAGEVHVVSLQVQSVAQLIHSWITGRFALLGF